MYICVQWIFRYWYVPTVPNIKCARPKMQSATFDNFVCTYLYMLVFITHVKSALLQICWKVLNTNVVKPMSGCVRPACSQFWWVWKKLLSRCYEVTKFMTITVLLQVVPTRLIQALCLWRYAEWISTPGKLKNLPDHGGNRFPLWSGKFFSLSGVDIHSE